MNTTLSNAVRHITHRCSIHTSCSAIFSNPSFLTVDAAGLSDKSSGSQSDVELVRYVFKVRLGRTFSVVVAVWLTRAVWL